MLYSPLEHKQRLITYIIRNYYQNYNSFCYKMLEYRIVSKKNPFRLSHCYCKQYK